MKRILLIILGLSSLVWADFSRSSTGIVTDSITGLQWQDDAIGSTLTWEASIIHCEDLVLDVYDDWRLPNIVELISLVDDSKFNPAIDNSSTAFQYTASDTTDSRSYYWSSTTNAYNNIYASFVYFYHGYRNNSTKNGDYYVRCVRGFGPLICPDGQYKKQGERICIPRTPTGPFDMHLPNCETGRLLQGTDTCDYTATPVDPPGLFLSCPSGEVRMQQGGSCVVNPFCTDADKDTYFAEEGCGTPVDCNDDNFDVNPGISEVCNGIDDNCDSQVDEPENLTPPLCSLQEGVCSGSVRQCGGYSGWLGCDYQNIPNFENPEVTCDGLDNDCDGQVDGESICPI